jgi:uncharacterized lipoprotein YmbA
MVRPSRTRIFLALANVGLTACVHVGHQESHPWRLFTLSPLPETEEAAVISSPGPVRASIGVGPIHLPGYLDQDEIVTRISESGYTLSDSDRWAEPLEDDIARVLARNLSTLLRTDQLTLHPWPAPQRPTYQLEIEMLRFEADTAGTAHLAAHWFLRDVTRRQTIAEKEVRLSTAAAGSSTEQTVASLSKALGDLSVVIADAVRASVRTDLTQSVVGSGDRGGDEGDTVKPEP